MAKRRKNTEEVIHAPDKVNRVVRFKPTFPGYRAYDLFQTVRNSKEKNPENPEPTKKNPNSIYAQLWAIQDDLNSAVNKLVGFLYRLQTGEIQPPDDSLIPKEPRSFTAGRIPWGSLQTLSYALLSGSPAAQDWLPLLPNGQPFYNPAPGRARASGMAINSAAKWALMILQKEYFKICTGQGQIPVFGKQEPIPLMVQNQGVTFDADGNIYLKVISDRNLRVAPPKRLGSHYKKVLARMATTASEKPSHDATMKAYRASLRTELEAAGVPEKEIKATLKEKYPFLDYAHGTGSICWRKRYGKSGAWEVCISYPVEVEVKEAASKIMGVDIGLVAAATLAVMTPAGKSCKQRKTLRFPEVMHRQYDRINREKRERLTWNREEYGFRAGRGQDRKTRHVDHVQNRIQNLTDTHVQVLASQIVTLAQQWECRYLVLENLTGITANFIEETEHLPGRQRASARYKRKKFLQGKLRHAISNAALKAGVRVIEIDPAHTSNTCSDCGKLWLRPPRPPGGGPRPYCSQFGRLSQSQFKCDCGYEGHADHNAALNIARKGLHRLETPEETTAGENLQVAK